MRRIGLLGVFLTLLSLTTAFAASLDVRADNLSSSRTDVSISVPTTALPPLASNELYMVGDLTSAQLVPDEPPSTGGNSKASFDFTSTDISTEDRSAGSGDKAYYVSWRSAPLPSGLRFDDQVVDLHVTRTAGTGGTLTAGLFDCAADAVPTTVTPACTLIQGTGSIASGAEHAALGPYTYTIGPGRELRLKIVNQTSTSSSIQWGYKAQNRSARLAIREPGQ